MIVKKLRVILIKPSKYDRRGYVERFRWGFMPNATLPFMRSLTPLELEGTPIEVTAIDEYVHTDLRYLELLQQADDAVTLLALIGVQSHQFHRALDLAAFAKARGVEHCVIGGPHSMTCDTTLHQNRGVSFALAEAELVWPTILRDAIHGALQPVYGQDQRWQHELDSPVLLPPTARDLRRYVVPLLGVYPARGCPFICNFCSVIKIAGRRVRSQSIDTTLQSLLNAKHAGVKLIMFTSDNFNKYPEAEALLQGMIDTNINLPFFVQCDTQIGRQPQLVELMGRAGCWQIFLGVESFDRAILTAAKKFQNRPVDYREIVRLCDAHHIMVHCSNILGFPQHTEAGILEHLRILRSLGASVASFSILTPIPGTEQYDDFLAQGLITEPNLDRFDISCLVWRHPRLSATQLSTLLYRCYWEFFCLPDAMKAIAKNLTWTRRHVNLSLFAVEFSFHLFSRFCALRRIQPMMGGVGRVARDAVHDYLPLRRARFNCELVPLPKNLALSEVDMKFNKSHGRPQPLQT